MEPMSGLFSGFDIAAAGMSAELRRSEIASANIANMHVTGGKDHDPYRRRVVVFEEALVDANHAWRGAGFDGASTAGVRVAKVYEDHTTPFIVRHEPGHPDADERGFVKTSNVDMFREMVDIMVIERSFQANVAAMQSSRNMVRNSVSHIGR